MEIQFLNRPNEEPRVIFNGRLECSPWDLVSCNGKKARFAFEIVEEAIEASSDPAFIEKARGFRQLYQSGIRATEKTEANL